MSELKTHNNAYGLEAFYSYNRFPITTSPTIVTASNDELTKALSDSPKNKSRNVPLVILAVMF